MKFCKECTCDGALGVTFFTLCIARLNLDDKRNCNVRTGVVKGFVEAMLDIAIESADDPFYSCGHESEFGLARIDNMGELEYEIYCMVRLIRGVE